MKFYNCFALRIYDALKARKIFANFQVSISYGVGIGLSLYLDERRGVQGNIA